MNKGYDLIFYQMLLENKDYYNSIQNLQKILQK